MLTYFFLIFFYILFRRLRQQYKCKKMKKKERKNEINLIIHINDNLKGIQNRKVNLHYNARMY